MRRRKEVLKCLSAEVLECLSAGVLLVVFGLGIAHGVTVTQYRCDELDHPVYAMTSDGHGGYWSYNALTGKIHGPHNEVFLYGNGCKSLALDADGKLWVSYNYHTVEIIDTRPPEPKVGARLPLSDGFQAVGLTADKRVYSLGFTRLRVFSNTGVQLETYDMEFPTKDAGYDGSDWCLCMAVDNIHNDIAVVTMHGLCIRLTGVSGSRKQSVEQLIVPLQNQVHIPRYCAFVGRYLAVAFTTDNPCVELYDRKTLAHFATIPADDGWQPYCVSATDFSGFIVAWNRFDTKEGSGRLVYYSIR